MKFEKIRKINKSKIIVGGVITLGAIGAITILPSHAKYKLTESINIVNGTINYKVPDIKVMAMYTSENGTNYTETTTMPGSGYIINEEKTYCTTDNVNQVKGKAYTNASGELVFKNLTKSDKCYLYFDKYTPPITVDDIIATLNVKSTTPNFATIATTDEGVYKVSDGMYGGNSYYWRGAVTNNHVIFANKCWRIIRINGDNTIRLIYNGAVLTGNTCTGNVAYAGSIAVTSQAYNTNTGRSEYVGYTYTSGKQRPSDNTTATASNLKKQTENWYSANITGDNASKVADGKFCNDRNTVSGKTWSSQSSSNFNYAVRERIETATNPTLNCPNSSDIYTLKVGAIMGDEVVFAGGVYAKENKKYYLYNDQSYWTITPSDWYNSAACMIHIANTGTVGGNTASIKHGIRPVINLKSDTQFAGGANGSQTKPYVVK